MKITYEDVLIPNFKFHSAKSSPLIIIIPVVSVTLQINYELTNQPLQRTP